MHDQIKSATQAAWSDFSQNHYAYLKAIVCILQVEKYVRQDPSPMRDAWTALNESTQVLGMDPIQYFKANLFFSQIAGVELFLQRVIKAVIAEYPKKIGQMQFRLAQITEAGSIDELIEQAADEYLNRLMYKKPFEYLEDICETLSIEKEKLIPYWPNFIEMKARRDIGIHNSWICNDIYLRKIQEVGLTSTVKNGDSLVPSDNDYIFGATDNLGEIATAILTQVGAKYA